MLILISDAFDESLPKVLSKYGQVTEDANRLPEADIVIVRSKTKATKEYLDQAKRLKVIIRGGVGLDNIDVEHAEKKGIKVHNTADASTTAVAELAFALMIALPNHLVDAHNSMKEGKWLKSKLERTELMGKTLGILGMGRIGTALAIRARAFRMRILAWKPLVYFSDFAIIVNDLEEILGASDYISMHMPLVDSTRGLINKKSLSWMKKGAYLINTGRGECVVEQDVAEALTSGQLGGYATDVWYSDPPVNSPLTKAPNMLMAPHFGAATKENMLRIGEIIEKIVQEYT
ncbi:MAG: hydroxyacid dehydrogenase, partial [Candidatus Zixiibacteriota bacterium]